MLFPTRAASAQHLPRSPKVCLQLVYAAGGLLVPVAQAVDPKRRLQRIGLLPWGHGGRSASGGRRHPTRPPRRCAWVGLASRAAVTAPGRQQDNPTLAAAEASAGRPSVPVGSYRTAGSLPKQGPQRAADKRPKPTE